MRSLDEIEKRAQRHLDGTRVNVDAMAKDVMDLVHAVRALQLQVKNISDSSTSQIKVGDGRIVSAVETGLHKQFQDIFGPGAGKNMGQRPQGRE